MQSVLLTLTIFSNVILSKNNQEESLNNDYRSEQFLNVYNAFHMSSYIKRQIFERKLYKEKNILNLKMFNF